MATKQKIELYRQLRKKISADFVGRTNIAVNCESALRLSVGWLEHFYKLQPSDNASLSLLAAAHSTAIEVTSSVACGLLRPAIFSLRSHYELFFMFLFYRDHPVEWKSLQRGDEWVRLPKELKTYLRTYYPWSEARMKKLLDRKNRTEDDPYFLLSAFVHGGRIQTLPKVSKPADTCFDLSIIKQLSPIAEATSEFLSDIATSIYSGNFLGLPSSVKADLVLRFGNESNAAKIFD